MYDFTLQDLESSEEFLSADPDVQQEYVKEFISQNGPDEALSQFDQAVNSTDYQNLPPAEQESFRNDYFNYYGLNDGQQSVEQPELTPADTTSFGDDAWDVTLSAIAGAGSIPKAIGMAAGFFGFDDTKESLLQTAKDIEDLYRGRMTEGGKQVANESFLSDKEGQIFGDHAIKKLFMTSAESAPLMLGTAPVGGLASAALSKAKFLPSFIRAVTTGGKEVGTASKWAHNLLAYGSTEAGSSALVSAADAGNKIQDMPEAELEKSPVYQELRKELEPEQARAAMRGLVEEDTAKMQMLATFLGSAVVPSSGGAIPKLFEKATGKGLFRDVIEGIGEESLQEATQSGFEGLAENRTTRQFLDPRQKLTEGLMENIALGGASGGLMGGAVGLVSHAKSIRDIENEVSNIPENLDPDATAEQIAATVSNDGPNVDITVGADSPLNPEEQADLDAFTERLKRSSYEDIRKIQEGLPILREKNPRMAQHLEPVLSEMAAQKLSTEFGEKTPGIESAIESSQQQTNIEDTLADLTEQQVATQDEADTRGRQYRFNRLIEEADKREQNLASLERNTIGRPSTAEESARAFLESEPTGSMSPEEIDNKRADSESAFSERDALIPKGMRSAISKIEQDLRFGDAGGNYADGKGNESTVIGREASNYPEWFKQKTVKRYDDIHGTSFAKVINKKNVLKTIAKVRNNKELNGTEKKVWQYLEIASQVVNNNDIQVVANNEFDKLEQEGFEFHDQKTVAVGNLNEGDEVVVLNEQGVPDKLVNKGRDKESGDIILKDGITMHVDEFDTVDIIAKKNASGKQQTAQPPFTAPKSQPRPSSTTDSEAEISSSAITGAFSSPEENRGAGTGSAPGSRSVSKKTEGDQDAETNQPDSVSTQERTAADIPEMGSGPGTGEGRSQVQTESRSGQEGSGVVEKNTVRQNRRDDGAESGAGVTEKDLAQFRKFMGDVEEGEKVSRRIIEAIERSDKIENADIVHKGKLAEANAELDDALQAADDHEAKANIVDLETYKESKDKTVVTNSKSIANGQEVNHSPSDAQKEAGNYKKGHVSVDGLDISIENPVGSTRSGTDEDGKAWTTEMKSDYGYIKGSVGYDKDHVDVFIAPGYQGGGKAFIVNQYTKDGSFDEHKVVLGAESKEDAMRIYNSNYEPGWTGGKSVAEMSSPVFSKWVKSNRPKKGPVAAKVVLSGPKETHGKTSFTTAKGSTYTFDGNTSQRNKAARQEHGSDSGIKRRSDLTVFIDPENAKEVGWWQSSNATGKRVVVRSDKIVLTSINEKTGKRGRDGVFGYSKTPEIGKNPLELWEPDSKGFYRGNHPGNEIVSIGQTTEQITPTIRKNETKTDSSEGKKTDKSTDKSAVDFDPWAMLMAGPQKFDANDYTDIENEISSLKKDFGYIEETKRVSKLKEDNKKLEAEIEDWQSRVYKKNNTQYEKNDQYGQYSGTSSIGSANERRRRRAISSLQQQINDNNQLIKEVTEKYIAPIERKISDANKRIADMRAYDDSIDNGTTTDYLFDDSSTVKDQPASVAPKNDGGKSVKSPKEIITAEDGRAYILEDFAKLVYDQSKNFGEYVRKIKEALGNVFKTVADKVRELYRKFNAHLDTFTSGSQAGSVRIGKDDIVDLRGKDHDYIQSGSSETIQGENRSIGSRDARDEAEEQIVQLDADKLRSGQTIVTIKQAQDWLARHKFPRIAKKSETVGLVDRLLANKAFQQLSVFDKIRVAAQLERPIRNRDYSPKIAPASNKKLSGQQGIHSGTNQKVEGSGIVAADTSAGCDHYCFECYALKGSAQASISHQHPVLVKLNGVLKTGETLRIGEKGDPSKNWQHAHEQVSALLDRSQKRGQKVDADDVFFITKLLNLDGFNPETARNLQVTLDPMYPEHMWMSMRNILRLKSAYPEVSISARIRSFVSKNIDLQESLQSAVDFANRFGLPILETRMRFIRKSSFDLLELDESAYKRVSNQYKPKKPILDGEADQFKLCDEGSSGCPGCKNCVKLTKGRDKILPPQNKKFSDEGISGLSMPETREFDPVGGNVKYAKSSTSGQTTTKLRAALRTKLGRTIDILERRGKVNIIESQDDAMGIINGDEKFAIRWHGTSTRGIKQLSTDYVGSGEGQRYFGFGIYVSESRGIAESYRRADVRRKNRNRPPRNLNNEQVITVGDDVVYNARMNVDALSGSKQNNTVIVGREVAAAKGDFEKARRSIQREFDFYSRDTGGARDAVRVIGAESRLKIINEWISSGATYQENIGPKDTTKNGQLYKVEIPEDEDVIYWDRKISSNSQKVQDIVSKIPVKTKVLFFEKDGQYLYKKLTEAFGEQTKATTKMLEEMGLDPYGNLSMYDNDQLASMYLLSKGLKGIKYRAGTFSNANLKAHNYVIFSGKDTRIVDVFYSKDGQSIAGFTLPDGTVHLVSDGIESGQGFNILLHELGVHSRRLAQSDKVFQKLLDSVQSRAEEDSATGRAIRAAMEMVPEDTKPEHVAEETLAYLVQSQPDSTLVRRIIARIKMLLAKVFGEPFINKLTAADLRAVAEIAVRRSVPISERAGDVKFAIKKTTKKTPTGTVTTTVSAGIHAVPGVTALTNAFSANDLVSRISGQQDRLNNAWEELIYQQADKDDPRRRIQNRATSARNDILTVERLRGKVTANAVERFMDKYIVPIQKIVGRNNLKVEDVEEYAYSLHVPERNLRMRQVNANRFIEDVKKHLNTAEEAELKDRMIDIRSDALMQDWTRAEKQDEFLVVLNDLFAKTDDMQNELDAKQAELDNRVFTQAEINKGTPERLQEQIDNRQKHIDAINDIASRWNNESVRYAGITDEEAQTIKDKWESDDRIDAIKEAVDIIHDINRFRLDTLYEAGQLSEQEYRSLIDGYEFYVPLHRDVDDNRPATGRPTGPLGKPLKVAKGSMKEVVHILAHSVRNAQAAIVRKHKAEAGKELLHFVQNNPDIGITLGKQEKKPTHDSEGNIVMYENPVEAEDELYLRVDGERYVLTFNLKDPTIKRFLHSIKNQDAMLNAPLRMLSKITRFLSSVNTSLSPEFVISNFARDLQTAGVNMEDSAAAGMQKKVLKGVFPAIKGIWQAEYGNDNTYWGRVYRDFAKNGGKIGWMQSYDEIGDLAKELVEGIKLYEKGHVPKKAFHKLKTLIETSNMAVENGVRLSVYDQLIKAGATPQKAALTAANLTVDFTRRGAQGPLMNALYMFFNAGVQGNVRIIKAAARSRRVRMIMGGIVGAGFALQMLAYAMGGDDPTGEPYVDGIKDFIKERNMIFMIPGSGGKYHKLPMPYGYNVFYLVGSELARATNTIWRGKKYEVGKGSARLLNAAMSSFNPLYSATVLQTLSPTVTDVFAQIAENASWTGDPLIPEQSPYEPEKANAYRYWKSASGLSKSIAQGLNRLTRGGGEFDEGGLIDWSPEWIELAYDTVTGSAGRFVKNMITTPIDFSSGAEIETKRIPFVNKVYGKWDDRAISERYYDLADDVERFKNSFKVADEAKRKDMRFDERAKIVGLFKESQSQIRKIRTVKNKAEAAGRDTDIFDKKILDIQTKVLRKASSEE